MSLEDLRKGRLEDDEYYAKVDRPFFDEVLDGFLPRRIIDIHSHVTSPEERLPSAPQPDFWAERVCPGGMTLPNLVHANDLLFPGREVTSVVFPMPSRRLDPEIGNRYVSCQTARSGAIPLLLTDPRWSPEELDRRAREGGFRGLKPYPVMAETKDPDGLEIYDYLPREHLELADERGWLVILHIPRPGRLADPTNIRQLLELDEEYGGARIVVAHVGRSYCAKFADGLDALGYTENLRFDISANTNQMVFERLIDVIGPDRILYGSDLPITAMHARRVCEGDNYVNIVLGADWEDSHTRLGGPADGITFFLYEEIAAFRRACESRGVDRRSVARVFHDNAARMLAIGQEAG
jgi:predicted TIM-barrel fold metal-dependent hydrolase